MKIANNRLKSNKNEEVSRIRGLTSTNIVCKPISKLSERLSNVTAKKNSMLESFSTKSDRISEKPSIIRLTKSGKKLPKSRKFVSKTEKITRSINFNRKTESPYERKEQLFAGKSTDKINNVNIQFTATPQPKIAVIYSYKLNSQKIVNFPQ